MLDRVLLLQFILNSKFTNHSDDNRQLRSVQWWLVLQGIFLKAISEPYQLEAKYELDNYFIIKTLTCLNVPRNFFHFFVISNFLCCLFKLILLCVISLKKNIYTLSVLKNEIWNLLKRT